MYRLYRDIANFFALKRTIKKAKKNAEWQKFNLRADWVCRVYTVVNPLDAWKGDDPIVLKQKMLEKTYPINAYMEKLNVSDIVAASWEKIPESESYLLVYYPIFNVITTWRIFVFFLFLTLGTALTIYFL